jgi:hypothetical protein
MVLTPGVYAPIPGDIRAPYRSTVNPSWRREQALDKVKSRQSICCSNERNKDAVL